jgi:hypothetical protein
VHFCVRSVRDSVPGVSRVDFDVAAVADGGAGRGRGLRPFQVVHQVFTYFTYSFEEITTTSSNITDETEKMTVQQIPLDESAPGGRPFTPLLIHRAPAFLRFILVSNSKFHKTVRKLIESLEIEEFFSDLHKPTNCYSILKSVN